jgi:hypothetical protein
LKHASFEKKHQAHYYKTVIQACIKINYRPIAFKNQLKIFIFQITHHVSLSDINNTQCARSLAGRACAVLKETHQASVKIDKSEIFAAARGTDESVESMQQQRQFGATRRAARFKAGPNHQDCETRRRKPRK